jgi:hypothetical protein
MGIQAENSVERREGNSVLNMTLNYFPDMNLGLSNGLVMPGMQNGMPPLGPSPLGPLGPMPWASLPVSIPYPQPATLVAPGTGLKRDNAERELKQEKRKQANRDSARKSKMKKKQENDELLSRRQQLVQTNQELVMKVKEAQDRVKALLSANTQLKDEYIALLS